MVEIRLRSKLTMAEIGKLKKIFDLSELAFVDDRYVLIGHSILERLVPAAADNPLAVRAERHARCVSCEHFEHERILAAHGIPHLERLVSAVLTP
jgi:hypothetical protein